MGCNDVIQIIIACPQQVGKEVLRSVAPSASKGNLNKKYTFIYSNAPFM